MDIKTLKDSIDVQSRMIVSRLWNCFQDLTEQQFIIKAANMVGKLSTPVYEEVSKSGEFLFPHLWERIKKLAALS